MKTAQSFNRVIMKKGLQLVTLLIFTALIFVGCDSDDGGDPDNDVGNNVDLTEYVGAGDWPEYQGDWASLVTAAGSKYSSWVYLDVTINRDGTFQGTYESYVYDYTWNMYTAWGIIPTPVYVPDGDSMGVSGVIDFNDLTGEMTFEGIGETTFDVVVFSESEVALSFPDGFYYSVANIQR